MSGLYYLVGMGQVGLRTMGVGGAWLGREQRRGNYFKVVGKISYRRITVLRPHSHCSPNDSSELSEQFGR